MSDLSDEMGNAAEEDPKREETAHADAAEKLREAIVTLLTTQTLSAPPTATVAQSSIPVSASLAVQVAAPAQSASLKKPKVPIASSDAPSPGTTTFISSADATTAPQVSILKLPRSNDASPSASRTYSRQQLLELRGAGILSNVPKQIPDVFQKAAAYLSDSNYPFEAGDKNRQREIPPVGESNLAPVNRLKSRSVKENIFREVRGILNKLTPENCESMVNRMHGLLNEQEERMKKVSDKAKLFNDAVGIIFDKIISEPKLVETYIKMCTFLNEIEFIDKENKKLMFKKVMLNYCQREFEDHDHGSERLLELQHHLEMAKTVAEKRNASKDLEDFKFVLKKKYHGNIRLIGELYRARKLPLSPIVDCINRLLREQDEETLEGLCELLRTIGKQFEEQLVKANIRDQMLWWRQCIEALENLVTERKGTSRICFFIRQVLEARRDSWNFKQKEESPKKIAEIRSDLERENAKKQKEINRFRGSMKACRGAEGRPKGGRQGTLRHIASSGDDSSGHEAPPDIGSYGQIQISTTSTDQCSVAFNLKCQMRSGSPWLKSSRRSFDKCK